jgi:alkyl sulfatase BDS1-like metallo-beta-lactamase superfamily hydrolase
MKMRQAILVLALSVLTTFGLGPGRIGVAIAQESQHFDPKGKLPSEHTIKIMQELRKTLPFADERDFDEAARGFISQPEVLQIEAEKGGLAWDIEPYRFLLDDETFDSIHPSLQRQATLNMNYGLFEVIPGIYQIRGYDLSNITFVEGETGWIIFDPLTAKETAAAALKYINKELGERPVTGVIFSHSHVDHFGGVRGVVDEERLAAGGTEIIAPVGFMHNAVSENVYAGNAMSRRLFYQYGVLLQKSPFGHVDQSIGKNTAAGNAGLMAPTIVVEDAVEEIVIDGVRMIFHNTPGTEAPAEMNTYLPDLKALWMAENVTGTIHNIYTLRGALIRDALAWSKYINDAIYRFGFDAEVMFASHSWPRWGKERILEVLRGQRDMYAHLNNQVLHLANKGVTINQIQNVYAPPKSLQEQWLARGYHGSMEHNSRGVINRYLGYWDGNPTTLIPLSPEDSAPLYVEMMGGAGPILAKARELYDAGQYRHAQEILNKLVYAEPQNQEAKDLLADAFEQFGYQQESPSVRNSLLAAAYELRNGIPEGASPKTGGPDMVRAMSTALWLDFLGIRMDSRKAEGMEFTINFITPDNGELFSVEMSNATLTNIQGYLSPRPDLTVTVNRSDLEVAMAGAEPFDALIEDGRATMQGDLDVYTQLLSTLDVFELGFEMMPGTGEVASTESAEDSSLKIDAILLE